MSARQGNFDAVQHLLVPDPVDEWAEEARQDAGEQEVGEQDGGALLGEGVEKDHVGERGEVGQHTDQELECVEQDGVAGLHG